MTNHDWIKNTSQLFTIAAIPTPRLDAELLIAHVLCVERAWVLAHSDEILDDEMLKQLEQVVKRRISHEPIAYILGKQEFYGRDFMVTPDTLTPRPETETMIELLIKNISKSNHQQIQIIDVGTGSGCIIITAQIELTLRNATYIGIDVSKAALTTARKNAKKYNCNINFKHFDLKSGNLPTLVQQDVHTIVLANLPYVPEDFHINLAATHEPEFAIFGGRDGLDYYRMMFAQLGKISNVTVFTESLPPQHEGLKEIASRYGFIQENEEDFIQIFAN